MPALPPASWHPDPEDPNQLRWWDGQQWTAVTMPQVRQADAGPTAVTSTPTSTSRKKIRKPRQKVWVVAVVGLGILIAGGVLAQSSPVVVVLASFAVAAAGIFALVARPLPFLGLRTRRSGFAGLGVAALLLAGGGIASAGTSTSDAPAASTAHLFVDAGSTASPSAPTPTASPTATRAATPTRTPTPTPIPTTISTTSEKVAIPFERTTVDDPQREQGTTAIVAAGVDGILVQTFEVKSVGGVETGRELVSETVELAPIAEVTAVGSLAPAPAPVPLVPQQGSGCDSNYTGACVPIASDVDCEGGGGNGPAYVLGPAQIVGTDIYDLDRDGNGIACD